MKTKGIYVLLSNLIEENAAAGIAAYETPAKVLFRPKTRTLTSLVKKDKIQANGNSKHKIIKRV